MPEYAYEIRNKPKRENMEKRNEIVEVSFDFALEIIKFTEILESKRKFVVANQLLRSGTSVGANIRESKGQRAKLISSIN